MTMLKLYYVPMTRAARVRWMLEELEVPYELIRLDPSKGEIRGEQNPHPLKRVPVLVDGDRTIIESAAICLYLADKFPERGLAPPLDSVDRGTYLQWIVYAMTELDAPLTLRLAHTVRLPEAERVPAVAARAEAQFREGAAFVERSVRGREVLVGDRFTTADLVVSGVLGWAAMQGLMGDFPELKAWSKKISSRPALQRARAD
jgi:glutathione S-transferase